MEILAKDYYWKPIYIRVNKENALRYSPEESMISIFAKQGLNINAMLYELLDKEYKEIPPLKEPLPPTHLNGTIMFMRLPKGVSRVRVERLVTEQEVIVSDIAAVGVEEAKEVLAERIANAFVPEIKKAALKNMSLEEKEEAPFLWKLRGRVELVLLIPVKEEEDE